MNIQIEHLENHIARLTVDVDQERLEKAKQAASRRIAGQVNIPGFRKGKAPYAVVLRYVGEPAILEEAIDKLSNEVFREALVESKIEPYAPGNLESVETEPTLKLVFTVPMQPSVSLGDYRDIRLPYEAPTVEDKAVDDTLARMLDARAVVEEPVDRPAQQGDQVKLNLHGTVIHPAHEHDHDEDEADDEAETPVVSAEAADIAAAADEADAEPAEAEVDAAPNDEADSEPDDEHEHDDDEPEEFINREVELVMYGDPERDFVPGFSDQIIGLKAGDEKEFTIAVPDDHPLRQYAGHTYTFKASVQEVRPRIVPVMDDEFAKAASEGKVENLLDLRIEVRKDLQQHAEDEATNEYADQMLAKIIEGAKVEFPEAMVDDYVDNLLQGLDERLRRNGLTLNQLMAVQDKTEADLRADYRDAAIARIQRDVVINELLGVEKLRVSDADIDTRITEISSRFSDEPAQIESFRRMLNRPESRNEVAYELAMTRMRERLLAIGKGDNPPIPADEGESQGEVAPAAGAQATPTGSPAEGEIAPVQAEMAAEAPAGDPVEAAAEQPPADAPNQDAGQDG